MRVMYLMACMPSFLSITTFASSDVNAFELWTFIGLGNFERSEFERLINVSYDPAGLSFTSE